ncbi:MAG: long-chain fatty acid--CoA ligase [Bacteroidia bacterium]|nr:MAG: long-chain fatty acid--CoA ligase [Bacteroidia bacterium]
MEVTRTFDILEWNIQNYPRKVAIAGKYGKEWKTWSTDEYRDAVNLVSYGLLSMGLKKGDKVATITGNRPEWSLVDMALSQSGMVHVPVYPTIGSEEYDYILRHSGARIIFISNSAIYKKMGDVAAAIPEVQDIFSFDQVDGLKHFDEVLAAGRENEGKYREELNGIRESVTPEDLLTIIYTSGTTGQPKGVMLSHRNIVSNFLAITDIHPLGFGDRAMSFLPLCHVYERMVNYHFQYKGISVYYIESMGLIMEMIKEVKPNVMNTVPRLVEKIYDGIINKGKNLTGIKKQLFFWANNLGLKYELKGKSIFYRIQLAVAGKLIFSKWREALGGEMVLMVSGGAALQPRLARIFWAAGLPIIEGYGLTESSPVIAVNPFRMEDVMFGTVGPVIDGIEVKIAEDGEILSRGPHIMMGYYNEPGLTSEVIDADGWLHTGDIGTLIEGKWLKITDRKKEIFKLSAGKYIAPQMIENRLKESFFIEQAMVIGENQKFASAIISPNFTFLHDWCSIHKIQYRDNIELIRNKDVIARIGKEVAEINRNLGDHEQVKRLRLVEDEWGQVTGELSPTLKLKRNLLHKRYADIIKEIYNLNGE